MNNTIQVYTVVMKRRKIEVKGELRMTFRKILEQVPAVTFPLTINGYKVLERDNIDRTLPAEY
jgi:hypothetical protein